MAKIKVLVVEDSDLVADVLTGALESDRKIKVVGRASNGKEALQMVPNLKPDLITMDVWMPVMDGFETVGRIMAVHPTPILVITSSSLKADVELSLRMIAAGALDVIEKPSFTDEADWKHLRTELVNKVKLLAGADVTGYVRDNTLFRPKALVSTRKVPVVPSTPPVVLPQVFPTNPFFQVVAIASSTGGPSALLQVLQTLPANFPATVLIVQHISEGFTQGLVDWLSREVSLKVKIAQDGDLLTPGTVIIAPDRRNMNVTAGLRIMTSVDQQPLIIPNADVLLSSVARNVGRRAIGMVLTGMGSDGAVGLCAIRGVGGHTIAQDQASSLIYGMPRVAYEMGGAVEVLPLGKITSRILDLAHRAYSPLKDKEVANG
jgi:two-component system chemotaxis response regulator CheB